jgi:hypothetical protein
LCNINPSGPRANPKSGNGPIKPPGLDGRRTEKVSTLSGKKDLIGAEIFHNENVTETAVMLDRKISTKPRKSSPGGESLTTALLGSTEAEELP